MYELFFFSSIILIIMGAIIRVNLKRQDLYKEAGKSTSSGPEKWPSVALIIPATGFDPALPECIASLINQGYPGRYQLIFVTRDHYDPAAAIIRQQIQAIPNARHIVSGKATTCGQKNHNLLAGIKVVGVESEILVFCDSTRVAPFNWLKEMVSPIASNRAIVTSGYHNIICGGCKIPTLGHAVSVLILYLTKGISMLNQPWGGGTAISKATFKALGVKETWAKNVVDDVSLAALLAKARIKVENVPTACLSTHLANETLPGWNIWLIRQWSYLKFCMPISWALAGIICYFHCALVLLAGVECLRVLFGCPRPVDALAALVFLTILTILAGVLKNLHSTQCPMLSWVMAAYVAFFMAAWSHMETILTQEIHWRGITYRVTRKGVVVEIRER
jgi:cellulose synthase/poly-beta-1,6-N-acetylglucosamine synthase-like glycosyltransferase